jgi:hypothetical protein
MKAQYTMRQLRRLADSGETVVPVFGLKQPVRHEPRSKFDPKPWTDGTFRYQTWELTTAGVA